MTTFPVYRYYAWFSSSEPTTILVEEPGRGTVTVARNGSLSVGVRVKFRTVDGTASAGDHDYVPIEETVITFTPGQAEYDIDVSVLDDSLPETDETFHLVLYDPEGQSVIVLTASVNR